MKKELNTFIIYTGLDGSGKSTRVSNQNWNWRRDPIELNDGQSWKEIMNIYNEYDVTDRFAPLDELVYSSVLNTPTIWSADDMIKFIKEYSKERNLDIRLGFTTYDEYEIVHHKRGETNYPDYHSARIEWISVARLLSFVFKENKRVKISFFHYEREYSSLPKLIESISESRECNSCSNCIKNGKCNFHNVCEICLDRRDYYDL